jgi:hypothetical protein
MRAAQAGRAAEHGALLATPPPPPSYADSDGATGTFVAPPGATPETFDPNSTGYGLVVPGRTKPSSRGDHPADATMLATPGTLPGPRPPEASDVPLDPDATGYGTSRPALSRPTDSKAMRPLTGTGAFGTASGRRHAPPTRIQRR